MKHYQTHKYSIRNFPFYALVGNCFNCPDLSELHKNMEVTEKFTMENNSDTKYHKMFYDKLRLGWEELEKNYKNFIKEVVSPLVGEDFVYQKWPTLRIHIPNNWATPEFHCDSQEGYNHPEGEINFILPLTLCYGTNAVWAESEPNKKDFQPLEGGVGDLITFNGNKCLHGNKENLTEDTRVTFDFRILPVSKYDPDLAKESNTTSTKFKIGGYYTEIE